ncbi:MAG: effector binding domain-containing protein [Tatlockia sp.]|nr:effector binding domain-containing protein [Tatlockia sp.]
MINDPKKIAIDGFGVTGLSVRTRNSEEFNPLTAKLPTLWQQFMSRGLVDFQEEPTPLIYGVYSDYDSDANGYYQVTAGVSGNSELISPELNSVSIVAGNYLMFSGKGIMPAVVISVWQRIWIYFGENQNHKRSFISDFELYRGADEIEIYIGIS